MAKCFSKKYGNKGELQVNTCVGYYETILHEGTVNSCAGYYETILHGGDSQ